MPLQDVLPYAHASRNLRRRTGIWLGVEAGELGICLCLSMIPDFAYRMGLIGKTNPLIGIGISGVSILFVILFKKGKQPNYFTLWARHHFLHPKEGWRAPRSRTVECHPILDDLKKS